MNKSELVHWLQEQRRDWETLLEQIGPARMEQPGANGEWSMKDLAAHLTGWQPRLTARLQAALRDEPEPPPPWPAHLEDEDDVNRWIYERNHARPFREVLEESRHVLQQFFAVIEALPNDVRIETLQGSPEREFYLVWVNDQRFPAGEFFDHFRDDHEPNVRAWLARQQQA